MTSVGPGAVSLVVAVLCVGFRPTARSAQLDPNAIVSTFLPPGVDAGTTTFTSANTGN